MLDSMRDTAEMARELAIQQQLRESTEAMREAREALAVARQAVRAANQRALVWAALFGLTFGILTEPLALAALRALTALFVR